MIWLVAVVVLLPFSGSSVAQGDERLAFLDEAPLEFDLNQAPGATQTVEVVNGDTRALDRLELRVSGLPVGVVVVEEPERTALQPGQVATFTIVRRGEGTGGEGRLVAVGSNGAVARRTVVLAVPSPAGDDLDEVTIRAWRMWPFSGWFDVDTVEVEGSTGVPADGPVGFVSTPADVAQVVVEGGAFGATGLGHVGEYTGKADLRPGADGGDLALKVLAKDIWLWPLAVLVFGLGVVGLINEYTRRDRPADVLRIRLARLLRSAADKEAASLDQLRRAIPKLNPVVPRIRGQGSDVLLLDTEVAKALDDFSNAVDDSERDRFAAEGIRWKQLEGYLSDYRTLLDRLVDIGRELSKIRIRRVGDRELSKAPVLAPILRLLQPPGRLADTDDLRQRLAEAEAALPRLKLIVKIQDNLLHVWDHKPSLRNRAESQLDNLWSAVGDLATEEADARSLYEEAAKLPATATLPMQPLPTPAAPGGATVGVEPRPELWRRGPRSGTGRWVVVAVGLILGVAFLYFLGANTLGVEGTRPTFGWPELHPSAAQLNVAGTVVLAVLGFLLARNVRRRVRRREEKRLLGEDEGSLKRALDRRDALFAVLSAFLVILSGMSLVYATDPTFGTPGDYLTILLWGTALTEGLTLARSLLPTQLG
ncbi:MAG TPA: hypothetical protein VJ735_21835 [Actinomycetes bacterium]|nr:hypothetical protein [Actinomycetes bacterium]